LAPRMRGTKISLFGNFGSLNIGNECTLQAVIHNIRIFLPNAEIDCICTNPEDVSTRHNVPALSMSRRLVGPPAQRFGWLQRNSVRRLARAVRLLFVHIPREIVEWARAIKALRGRDMLLMTGTGMLTDCTEGPLGLPYQIFKWALSAKLCRLRLLFVSVGVEPIRLSLTTFFIKTSLRLADYVCFRDHHSQDYMSTMGFKGESVISPDLAFSLPEEVLPRRSTDSSQKRVVGVGLFDYEGGGSGGTVRKQQYRDYIEKLSAFVAWLVERGHPVRVLIGDMRYDNPVRNDLRTSLAAMGIKYEASDITDEPVSSVANVLDQIAATAMVVASRYHNLVFALMLKKPVISISYEAKNDSLMGEFGLSDYCQPIDRLDLGRLCEQFVQLEKNADTLKTQMERMTTEYRRALAEQYIHICASKRPFPSATLSSNCYR
jgi:polysaccharide pyruvyl transferase WcaK-like protein